MRDILKLVNSAFDDLVNKQIIRRNFSGVYINEGTDFVDFYVDRNYLKNIVHFKIKKIKDQRYPEDFIIRLSYTDSETNILPTRKPISIYSRLEDILDDSQQKDKEGCYTITLDMLMWLEKLVIKSVSDYTVYTNRLRSRCTIDGNDKLFVDLRNLKLIKIESYLRLSSSKDASTKKKKVRGLNVTDFHNGHCLATLEDVTITPLKGRSPDEILRNMWDPKSSSHYISSGQLLSTSTIHSWVITEGIRGITHEFIERWK